MVSTKENPVDSSKLIETLINEKDSDARWEIVELLVESQDTDVLLKMAQTLCKRRSVKHRVSGIQILYGICVSTKDDAIQYECLNNLLYLRFVSKVRTVINEADSALLECSRSIPVPRLLIMGKHEDAGIRYVAAMGLAWKGRSGKSSVKAMIELSRDVHEYVRTWATFGLCWVETDTPQIREALFNRLDDTFEDTREDALIGLARRHDERVLEIIKRDLRLLEEAGVTYLNSSLKAAMEMGDPRLCHELMALKNQGLEDEELDEAISACCPLGKG